MALKYAATDKKIPMADLFDGRLAKFGVCECTIIGHGVLPRRLLTDGREIVWISANEDGVVESMEQPAYGPPNAIVQIVGHAFDTGIASEGHHRYWGFETKEEWDAHIEKMDRQEDDELYDHLVKYLRGEPHGIEEKTVLMCLAEHAKALVANDPGLLQPERKYELIDMIASSSFLVRAPATGDELTEKGIPQLHGDIPASLLRRIRITGDQ